MNGGLQFRLLGVPVRVLWMFFLIAFLLAGGLDAGGQADPLLIGMGMVVIFVSVLLHEMGHAMTYRHFGVQPSVVLHGFGGLTFGRSLPVHQDLLVSLAGPAAGLSIGLPLWWLYSSTPIHDPYVRSLVFLLVWVNVGWSLFNLVPMMPLDGGNATNALLSLVCKRDMTRVARVISIVTATGVVLFALSTEWIFLAVFAGWFGFMNIQALGRSRSAEQSAAAAPTVTRPPVAAQPPPPPAPGVPGPAAGWAAAGGAPPGQWTMPDAPPSVEQARRPGPAQRTFAHEVDATARALSEDEPALAAIALDRARRMAVTPNDHAVVGQLDAEVRRRLAGA